MSNSPSRRGFSLVEMIVATGIAFVILSVVLYNQSTYTKTNSLVNLADEISLLVTQAQTYGAGVKELSQGSNDFSVAYGLSFNLLSSGSNNAYVYFADRNGDGIYNDDWSCPIGGTSECLEKFSITQGNYIELLCAILGPGNDNCTISRIDITFVRPNTSANSVYFNNGGNQFSPSGSIGAKVKLRAPTGVTRRAMSVYDVGQVTVSNQ